MRNTKYVPVSPEERRAIRIENLEYYMKEWNCSRYEVAYEITFEYYAGAGFEEEILEEELKSMSEEELIHHFIEEL